MIAFELVVLNTRFYRERILVIDTVSKFHIHLKEKLWRVTKKYDKDIAAQI